jgi:tRNA G10  N-methylase Trm11
MQVEGSLKRFVRVEVHALSKISNSQIWARRRDNPRIGLFDASKDAHESRFATAVGTDETNTLVIADAEGNVLKNGLDAVRFVNVMCSKHR